MQRGEAGAWGLGIDLENHAASLLLWLGLGGIMGGCEERSASDAGIRDAGPPASELARAGIGSKNLILNRRKNR